MLNERRFLAQHSVGTLLRHCFEWPQHCLALQRCVLLKIVAANTLSNTRQQLALREWEPVGQIVNYYILSEVCMIKTAPHSTVSPRTWCIKSMKGWFTPPPPPRFVGKTLWSKLVERKKFGLICFPSLIYCDQEPLWLLNVIECTLGVHMRLSTWCQIWFTPGVFANYSNHLAFLPKVTWTCSKAS